MKKVLCTSAAGAALPSTLIFEHPTARRLAQHLSPEVSCAVESEALEQGACASGEPSAAVIGLSATIPAGAASVDMAWGVATTGSDTIGEVPAERWDEAMRLVGAELRRPLVPEHSPTLAAVV